MVAARKPPEGGSNTIIKFGPGYEAPGLVEYGTVAERKANLIEAFGLDPAVYNERTLAEVVVEASRYARGVYEAANKLTDKPYTVADKSGSNVDLPHGGNNEPEVEDLPATEVSLEERVKQAASVEELGQLWKDNRSDWTKQLTELSKARKAELEEK